MGLGMVGLLYILANVAYFTVGTPQEIAGMSSVSVVPREFLLFIVQRKSYATEYTG